MAQMKLTVGQAIKWETRDIEASDNSGPRQEIHLWSLTNYQPGTASIKENPKYDKNKDDGKNDIKAFVLEPGQPISNPEKGSLPMMLRFVGFPSILMIELPQNSRNFVINWTDQKINAIVQWLRFMTKDETIKAMPSMMKKLYLHREEEKFPFLMLAFKRLACVQHAIRLLKDLVQINELKMGPIRLKVWEEDINPVRRLLTIRSLPLENLHLSFAGWFQVMSQPVPVEEKISKLQDEYYVDWQTLRAVEAAQCQSWVVQPRLLSYDLESYSHNHAAFPVKYDSRHVVYMISEIYQVVGRPESRKYMILLTGDINPVELINQGLVDKCNNTLIEGAKPENTLPPELIERARQILEKANREKLPLEVRRFENEESLLNGHLRIVEEYQIDIKSGYNIHAFDNPYMKKRMELKGLPWYNGSRLKNHQVEIKGKSWKSSGSGFNDVFLFDLPGVLSFDLFSAVKRQFKMRRYDLSTVGMKFIKRKKNDVSARRMFEIYEDYLIARAALKACTTRIFYQHDQLVEMNRTALVINPSLGIEEQLVNLQAGTIINYLDLYVELRKDVRVELLQTVVHDYILARRQLTEVAEYAVRDSELVIDIFEKINCWIGLVEMSNAVGVSIEDLYTRGQQVRGLSLIFNLAAQKGFVVDGRTTPRQPFSGGFVYDPIAGFYQRVICLDFKSLYPSIIMAMNICYSTLIPAEKMEWYRQHHPEMVHIIEWDDEIAEEEEKPKSKDYDFEEMYDSTLAAKAAKKAKKNAQARNEGKTRKVHYCFMFMKKEYKLGILPQLVGQLVSKRREVVATMKHVKDPVTKAVLNERQNALKVTANSLYGLLGVQDGGVIPLIEGAMCVTAMGRRLVNQAAKYARDNYGAHMVYGDTDSIMFQLNGENDLYQTLIEMKEFDLTKITPEELLEELNKYSLHAQVGLNDQPIIELLKEEMEQEKILQEKEPKEKRQIVTPVFLLRKLLQSNEHKNLLMKKLLASPDNLLKIQNPPPIILTDGKDCWEWGKRLELEISATFPDPLYTEFEKCGDVFTVTKKRYAFWMYNKEGICGPDLDKYLLVKGLIMARRDGAEWQLETFNKILMCIMTGKSREEVLRIIIRAVDDMYRGRVSWQKVVVVKSIGDQYKSDSYFMKVFGDELRRIGRPAQPGDRLDYLMVICKKEFVWDQRRSLKVQQNDPEGFKYGAGQKRADILLGMKMRLPDVYTERLQDPQQRENLDVLYYIENVLMNCVEQLYYCGYRKELEYIESQKLIGNAVAILNEVGQKFPTVVTTAMSESSNDPIKAVELLSQVQGMKTKVDTARKKYVTGQKVFDFRHTKTPIKQLMKAIHRGLYLDLIKQWDPQLFNELYPNYRSSLLQFTI